MHNHSLCTIREFRTKHLHIIVDAIPDDSCLDDLHSEPDQQAEIAEKLDSGEWQLFTVRARAFANGSEIASDYLGGCIYADISEFQDHRQCAAQTRKLRAAGSDAIVGSYFSDMVRQVCHDARAELRKLQSIRVR